MPKGYSDEKEYKGLHKVVDRVKNPNTEAKLKSGRTVQVAEKRGDNARLGTGTNAAEREKTARHLERLAKTSKTETVEDTTRTELRQHAAVLRAKTGDKTKRRVISK